MTWIFVPKYSYLFKKKENSGNKIKETKEIHVKHPKPEKMIEITIDTDIKQSDDRGKSIEKLEVTFCSSCGSKLREDAMFCGMCGNPVK